MRRAATAAFATTVLALSYGASSAAGASPAETPPVSAECELIASYPLVSDAICAVLNPLEPTVAPVTDQATAPVAPVAPVVPGAPAPTPAPETSSSPPTAPSSSAEPAVATSSTTPAPASLGGRLGAPSSSGSGARQSTSRVPDVPVGSTLELGPLALPRLSGPAAVTTVSPATADAVAERMVLPAARAAAALPTHSRTPEVAVALGTLLAAGLLMEQARRARRGLRIIED